MSTKQKEKQTEAIFMRISKETKAKIQLLADKDRRNLTDFCRIHLENLVNK